MNTTEKTAKEILNKRFEAIKDTHYFVKDVLSSVLTDENYLPKNVNIYVTYNNPATWYTNVNICGCNLNDLSPEEARIVAAWFIEKYVRACGMPEVYIDHTASENHDFTDLVSGAYHELHVINDNIRLNDHWGTKEKAGIYVDLRAPKKVIPESVKLFFINRFSQKS